MLYVVVDILTKQEEFLLSSWSGQIFADRNRKEWGRLVFEGKYLQGFLNFHKEDKISIKRTVTSQSTGIKQTSYCFHFVQFKAKHHGMFSVAT